MTEPTAPPTTVAVGVEHVTVAPHPDLKHITVLSVFQGREVPAGVAWLSPPECRSLAASLDPDRPAALWTGNQSCTAEMQRLNGLLEPARYVVGPAECADPDDRSCDEYFDQHGVRRPDVPWCSHVEHRHASFADVRAREWLERMVLDVRRMAESATLPEPHELVEDIDAWLESLRTELDEIGGRAAFSVADMAAATAELDEATRRWNERDGAEDTRRMAEELHRLRSENGQIRAELDSMERAFAELALDEEARAALIRFVRRPCTRCGRPVPAAETRCDPVCPTVVVPTGGGS